MPAVTYEVRTDAAADPVFPSRCPGCGREPGAEVRFVRLVRFARGGSGLVGLLPLPGTERLGGPRRIVVPSCRRCAVRDLGARVGQAGAGLAVVLASIFGGLGLASLLAPPSLRLAAAFVIAAPAVLFGLSFVVLLGPPHEVRRDGADLVHDFRSPFAAVRFARANGVDAEGRRRRRLRCDRADVDRP